MLSNVLLQKKYLVELVASAFNSELANRIMT